MASNIDDHVQEFERFKKSIAEIDSVLKDYVYHAQGKRVISMRRFILT